MSVSKQKNIYKNPVEISEAIEKRSLDLLHLIGYIILIFTVIDFGAVLVPPRLTDPVWEFQTIGQLVERIWSPLLGLLFVFVYTQKSWITPTQIFILRFLSWLALVSGLLYLLMLPLGINNGLTIYKNNNTQIATQLSQQTEQLQQISQQLNTANPEQLIAIARAINLPNNSQQNPTTEELRTQLSQQIKTALANAPAAAARTKRQQFINWLKTFVRVNVGAVLSGVCLIMVWNLTRWVRVIHKNPA